MVILSRDHRLREIIRLAYEKSPATRAIFEGAGVGPGDIRFEADLDKIPITRKDQLLELQRRHPPFGGFLAVPIDDLERVFMSPGPLYDPQGQSADPWRFSPAVKAAGFQKGDIVLNTFSYHLSPAGFMFDKSLRSVGAVVIPAGVGNHELQIQIMQDLAITGYAGTPSYLLALIEKAKELGKSFPGDFRLHKALVTAEPLPPSLRQSLFEHGITVYQCYGTADAGCVAYECPNQDGMHLHDETIVQIVDPETGREVGPGETGEIVVTALDEIYPLIRFGTGDLSHYTTEACYCGRSSPRLLGLKGRVGEAIKVRGMFVHPRQLDEVMVKFPEVSAFQAVITRTDHKDDLTINIEASCQETDWPALQSALSDRLRDVLRVRAEVARVAANSLPQGCKKLVDQRVWD